MKKLSLFTCLISSLALTANAAITAVVDHHSFANLDHAQVKHVSLDLSVDFKRKVLHGHVILDFEKIKTNTQEIILDTRDLNIHSVMLVPSTKRLKYTLGPRDDILGSALSITLPAKHNAKTFKLKIEYQTSPAASGLQWLTPEQTADKKHPFLFSQSQAIHARSWIPSQDTPQIRTSYDATIRTDKGLLAVMSAENKLNAKKTGTYHFKMPQPIPAYLMAIAVGDLDFKAIGKQTGVYAEPSVLESAANEFADTQAMLEVCEKLYGPYRWGRYDLLVLPPSFPFGGMENPRLSFITPTVIAGDRSLVNLIAHELTHSWSGNLVTNATWEDLWLNEGFTTYTESRVMEEIFGIKRADMENVLAYENLVQALNRINKKDTALALNLKGRDPDQGFTDIAYNKGQLFNVFLEKRFGREIFDRFLTQYFNDHAFQSVTTKQYLHYLQDKLLNQHKGIVKLSEIEKWIYEPGLPKTASIPTSDAFSLVENELQDWLESRRKAKDLNTKDWVVHQWLYFLNKLPKQLSIEQLKELDQAFELTNSKNNEIAHAWLLIAIRHNYQIAFDRLENYLVTIGRRRLVIPLYMALFKTNQGHQFAMKVFEKAKPGYHPLTTAAFHLALSRHEKRSKASAQLSREG